MKRLCGLCLLLSFVLMLCSCTPSPGPAVTPSAAATPLATASPAATAIATSAETAASTPGAAPSDPNMYSSYARMVSYDPAVGCADFDYFDMLRGDEAVQWLVDHEGYTLADAQAHVDDFADSEFVEKNTSTTLRTISLIDVPLKLMYQPDGTPLPGADPIDAELIDLYNLYHVDPDLVLHSFFWHITVEDGEVVSVEQVYWP